MNEKISNTIAAKQQNINEIIKLKDKIRLVDILKIQKF